MVHSGGCSFKFPSSHPVDVGFIAFPKLLNGNAKMVPLKGHSLVPPSLFINLSLCSSTNDLTVKGMLIRSLFLVILPNIENLNLKKFVAIQLIETFHK